MSRFGLLVSQSHRIRMISVVRSFFARIEVLEHPERPRRELFARGNALRYHVLVPRFIPDPNWHRIIEPAHGWTGGYSES